MPLSCEHPSKAAIRQAHRRDSLRSRVPWLPTDASRRVQGNMLTSAAAVRPWPWRSISRENTSHTSGKEVKQLLVPHTSQDALGRSVQQVSHSVWHGIELEEGSLPHQTRASAETIDAAVAAFKVHNSDLLQDVFNCLVLAETVYKVQQGNHAEVASTVSALREDFPPPLVSLQRMQWSLPHVPHRYLLAEDRDALYVSFIGTKQRRDIMTNANIMQETLWPDLADDVSSAEPQDVPAAHTGFLNRARGVPIHHLYKLAKGLKKRLVLTGHSLGGAVALLCTLDLLHSLGEEANPNLACVGFATPAVGNAALADYIKQKGWHHFITNYLVPEDVVTRLLPPQQATSAQSADQAAEQAAGPAHPALWASLADQPASSSASPGLGLGASTSPPSSPSSSSISEESSPRRFPALRHGSSPHLPPRLRSSRLSFLAQATSDELDQGESEPSLSRAQKPVPMYTSHLSTAAPAMPLPHVFNNIVSLHAPAQHSVGSKLVYSSEVPSTESGASSTDRSSQPTNIACTKSDQPALDTDSKAAVPNSLQQQQQQQQQPPFPANVPGRGIWTRTAQLARLVSFPVRATRAYYSYVPLGQQLYLNPQMVATSLNPDLEAAPHCSDPNNQTLVEAPTSATAPALGASDSALPLSGADEGGDALTDKAVVAAMVVDSVVQQRREQLGRLWMHRMPTYRARFHQILYAALSQPLPQPAPTPDQPAQHSTPPHVVLLSRPIAPEVQVVQAETCAGWLSSHHLKDMLQDGVSAVAEQPGFRWFWIWSGAWPAIRRRLRRHRQHNVTVHIAVDGHGLEHATTTVVTSGAEVLTSRIVQRSVTSNMPWPNLDGFSIMQAAFAMFLVGKPAKRMVLEVVVPSHLMHRAQSQWISSGSLGLEVTVQSDFYSTTVPVSVHSDAQALQDSFAGMLAVCRLVSALLLKKSKAT